jgi:sulfur carrier protein
MLVRINGENQEIEKQGITVTELLSLQKVEKPEMVSVQLNGKILNRCSYHHATLKDGDQVDFLYFMGGGGLR